MLDKIMWNIFEKTGNIYAYLYVKEYNEYLEKRNGYCYNKNEESDAYAKKPLKLNEITIVT